MMAAGKMSAVDKKREEQYKSDMQDRIQSVAMGEGIKYGVTGSLIGGIGSATAHFTNKSYAKLMSTSAKTSIPVMAGLLLFSWRYEVAMHDAMRFPENWGLSEHAVRNKKVTKMPIHHRLANFLYDYPFTTVLTVAVPIAGFTLKEGMKLKHITWSGRLMQTRVYAQGGILVILLSTMAFRDYMNGRGRFPEPDGEVEEKDTYEKF